MAAGKLDLSLEQGATWRRQLTWHDPGPDADTLGPLKDLTGCTAHLQIRNKVGGTMLLELTDESGITLGGTAGTIDILFTGAQTLTLTVKSAVYDLYVIFIGDDPRRVLEGKVSVDFTVTTPIEPDGEVVP